MKQEKALAVKMLLIKYDNLNLTKIFTSKSTETNVFSCPGNGLPEKQRKLCT